MSLRIGIVGARGHVGAELIGLIAGHPALTLDYVGSRELDGQPVGDHHPAYRGALRYGALTPSQLPDLALDAVVLALPNGKAGEWVAAIATGARDPVIVDLSADYRFDDNWYYGLPELHRDRYDGRRRIANPGCYATAMQLAIAPMASRLAAPVQCFGVSGYSGAGTSPCDRNDPDKLRDNLMPYSLVGHVHEREVGRHLDRPVEFLPHVAPHFRGITLTANLHLSEPVDAADLRARYEDFYAGEALIEIGAEAPSVSAIAGRHGVRIGGFTVADHGRRAVVVACLDNLLKGAATQALQNLNLALGRPELEGIPP